MNNFNEEEYLKKYLPKEKQKEGLERYLKGEPVQYIIGNVNFYGYEIKVTKGVLIPRFETETLIEKTINYLKKLNINNPHILEIGTGTGCISIVLKKEIDCSIKAIDINKKAINLANENAKKEDVKIDFELANIEDYIDNKKYDLIISNPPYVPYGSEVDEKVKYEPENAIFAEENGLYFYRIILNKIKNNLKDKYLIAFEIGDKQGKYIKEIIQKYLPNAYILIEKDYNNHDRYAFISSMKFD